MHPHLHLVALVDIHDGLWQMADDENHDDPGEQGGHGLVSPVDGSRTLVP